MKILLLGDYSNYHACLGRALAREGHQVTVASDGGAWMNTARTISLDRSLPGKAGGLLLFAKMFFDSRLKGFDIVSLINPSFATLKPERLKIIFDKLKKNNGKIFLGSIGTDKATMDYLQSPDCALRYSEYYSAPGELYLPNLEVLEKDRLWQQGAIGEFCEYVYDNVAGITTALYEYHLAMQKRFADNDLKYVGIPVETNSQQGCPTHEFSEKLKLFLGRHSYRKKFKGTDRLEVAARRVAEEFPEKCEFILVEDQPYSVYIEKLKCADIVLDQLYSYTPATNALLAMADGKAVVSGGEPEYYEFIGESSLRPIINAVPDDEILYHTVRDMVLHREEVLEKAAQGPEFVARHNDSSVVANRHIEFWESKL